MSIPSSSPPTITPSPNGQSTFNVGQAPQDSSLFGGGFEATNSILGGENNLIKNSRRCTIIGGASNEIDGKYNTHVLGDYISAGLSNAFYVGCINGLHLSGDVVAYSSSDIRLKDNIRPIDNPLAKILSLDSVEFDWNKKQETYEGHDIGLIAQQVREIAPELITTRSSGYLAIKYDKLSSLLVGAIKEQQNQIKILNDRVDYLLKKVESMN